jgi:hypothetical protein
MAAIKGRLGVKFIRKELVQIQRDLSDRSIRFSAKERLVLHRRIEALHYPAS